MIDLNRYITQAQYLDGGREFPDIDCWALVRMVRHDLGYPWLPSFSEARATDPRRFTECYRQQALDMETCEPEPGAIAAVFRGQLCVHVGILVTIDGRLAALEMAPATGCRWLRIPEFERQYRKVAYYRDKNLPEPT